MNFKQRFTLGLVASALGFGLAAPSYADYPDRPVRLIVGYAPGGPVDTTARVFSKYLGDKLGQTVVVENRSGASGIIGADSVVRAPADGYVLGFVASPTMTMSPQVQRNTSFKPREDFDLLGLIVDYTNVLLVGPGNPAKSVEELIAAAKADPTAISFASAGVGASNHLSAELMKMRSNAPMLHVPYRGNSPAMMDVISGKVTFMFDITSTAMSFIKGGKARALAVTSRTRNPEMPDVPTMIEAGIADYEVTGWYALVGPKGMPADVSKKLQTALKEVLQDPAFTKSMVEGGYTLNAGGPAALKKRIDDEYALWGEVIKRADIKAE